VTDWSGTAGWRTDREFGNGHTLNVDLSARYGWSKILYSISQTVNPSMGPDSPLDFTASNYVSDEMALNADFVYAIPLDFLFGPLTFNFGAEYRREGFEIGAAEESAYTGGPWAAADPFGFCTNEEDVSQRTLEPGAPTDRGINCANPTDPV